MSQKFQELENAELELVQLVQRTLAEYIDQGVEVAASEIVDAILLERPDLVQKLAFPGPSRVWYCSRESLHLDGMPWVRRGGDEYGNSTVAFRVPFGGQVVVNVAFPMKRRILPLSELADV